MLKYRRISILILSLILLVVGSLVSVTMGAADISPKQVGLMLISKLPIIGEHLPKNWTAGSEIIVFKLRLPRIFLAILIGGGLASSGVAFQGLFRNPMADPYIIGVSSGASLGAALALVSGFGYISGIYSVPLLAFSGAMLTVVLVYGIARKGSGASNHDLLLAGVAVSSLASALVSLVMVMSNGRMDLVIYWLMGSLAGRGTEYIYSCSVYMLVGFGIVAANSKALNLMLLGEEPAQHLGVELERVKITLLVAGSLMAAAAVSAVGVIGFIGLIVPHVTRLLIGPDHRYLLPTSAVLGALFLLISDAIARTALAPVELPVGVITAVFGAPFFLYLLRKNRRQMI